MAIIDRGVREGPGTMDGEGGCVPTTHRDVLRPDVRRRGHREGGCAPTTHRDVAVEGVIGRSGLAWSGRGVRAKTCPIKGRSVK
jgi:hypothetical protein